MKAAIISGLVFTMIITHSGATAAPDAPQVVTQQSPLSPFVSFRIWVKTGSASDPKGKEGLAYLTASLIDEGGTLNNSYETILKKLFPMAASYNVQVDREMTVLAGTVHKDHVQGYYVLLRDAILSPAFIEDDFKRVKTDQINFLSTTLRYSSDEELGKALLHSVAMAGTSYAHPEQGLVKSVESITLDDVRSFYSKHYTRDNITLGLGGCYSDALLAQVKQDFSALPAGAPPAPALPALPAPKNGLQVYIVEKETRSTAISFGHPTRLTRADDDFYPMMIANSWLGEHRSSSSHLYQVMREARGMNYGDYSYIEWFPRGGATTLPSPNVGRHRQMFEVWIRPVMNANRHFALRQAMREVSMWVEPGMKPEWVELTRNYLLNFSLNYAPTESMRLGYRLDDAFYGLPQSHLERIQQRVKTTTADQVNAAIKRHVDAANMWIVIITQDAEALKKALVENATSPIKYDSPTPDEILAEDKIIQDYKLAIAPENVHVIPVGEVFEK